MTRSQSNLCGRVIVGLILTFPITRVTSHGRLIEPPSRASMWRYGFNTPHDYNDHESYCGGFSRQWQKNNGKCGICGDAWDVPEPRAHETGGKYGNSVIVRRYPTGSVIPVKIELTANHMGFFEFRICAMTYSRKEVSQDCLDKYKMRDRYGNTRYYPAAGNGVYEIEYKLPDDLTCTQCVFQWKYIAGNNWGDCGNGTGAVGCGPQEEFRACADVAIGDNELPLPETTTKQPSSTESPFGPAYSAPVWLFNLIISVTCLLVVLAALVCAYAYYYHAEKAKKWLQSRRWLLPEKTPVAPPRTKRQPGLTSHMQLQTS